MQPTSFLGSGLGSIPGITRTSLWESWKAVRQELRNASVRDVVDFLEYDVDPDKWINSVLNQIASGRFEPSALLRFTLGKSLGFCRTMTLPSVPDLVLYRAIDCFYSKAKRKQHQHVYFRRKLIQTVRDRAQQEAADEIKATTGYTTRKTCRGGSKKTHHEFNSPPSLTVLAFCNLRAAQCCGILCTLPMSVGPDHPDDEFSPSTL